MDENFTDDLGNSLMVRQRVQTLWCVQYDLISYGYKIGIESNVDTQIAND